MFFQIACNFGNSHISFEKNMVCPILGYENFNTEFLEFEENSTKITVEIGSAWHFCGIACRISINGKYHAGNRVVWFSKKTGI